MVTSGKQFAVYDHVILCGSFVGVIQEISVFIWDAAWDLNSFKPYMELYRLIN